MAQLIHIRQRIKTIETIQKITYAMRLISMSSHSRLKSHYGTLKKFVATAFATCHPVYHHFPEPFLAPHRATGHGAQRLVIAIGSQKGLSGGFNTILLHVLGNHLQGYTTNKPSLILIGKQFSDFACNKYNLYTTKSYTNFTDQTYRSIAQSLVDTLYHNTWSSVSLISNYPASFFIQKPVISPLIPFDLSPYQKDHNLTFDYAWYQNPYELGQTIFPFLLRIHIEKLLFESLLAEQAARFLSMDSATRNADKLLQKMRLDYNKLRQSVITREVVELSSSFS